MRSLNDQSIMQQTFVRLALRSLAISLITNSGTGQPSAWNSDILHGVAPDALEMYIKAKSSGIFWCLDGSKAVPGAYVNDDACDCSDGSDEPGTAACAGISGARFYCENKDSVPKFVPSSHVRDGICDCCDGTDEMGSRYISICKDTCVAEGATRRADLERRRNEIKDGLRLRDLAGVEAATKVKLWSDEKSLLHDDIANLEQQRADLLQRWNFSEGSMNSNVSSVLAATEEIIFEEDFERGGAPKRWKVVEKGGATIYKDGQRGKVLAMNSCTWGGMAFSKATVGCSPGEECRISFWAKGAPWQGFSRSAKKTLEHLVDAHSWLAVPKTTEDVPDRLTSTECSSEWTRYEYEFPDRDTFQMFGSDEVRFSSSGVHIMLQAHDSTGRCGSTMFDEIRVVRLGRLPTLSDTLHSPIQKDDGESGVVSEYARWALSMQPASSEESSQEQGVSTSLQQNTTQPFSEVVANSVLSSEGDLDLKQAQAAFQHVDLELRNAKIRRLNLEKQMGYLDSVTSSRWAMLIGACVSTLSGGYNYSICFFDEAKQESIKLGTFHSWDPHSKHVMIFKHGHRCHAGPARQLKAHLVCGAKTSFVALSEPSRCEYDAVVETPLACEEDDLRQVTEQMDLLAANSQKDWLEL